MKKKGLLRERSLPRNPLQWQRINGHRGLLGRHPEVVLADDVVAVELAARQGRSRPWRLARGHSHHVSGRGATQVVEEGTSE